MYIWILVVYYTDLLTSHLAIQSFTSTGYIHLQRDLRKQEEDQQSTCASRSCWPEKKQESRGVYSSVRLSIREYIRRFGWVYGSIFVGSAEYPTKVNAYNFDQLLLSRCKQSYNCTLSMSIENIENNTIISAREHWVRVWAGVYIEDWDVVW